MIKKLKKLNFATLIFAGGGLIAAGYFTTYLFPVTDNAFVIDNVTPIAAMVSGYVSEIYVENGQKLHKGDPILLIHPEAYQLEYNGVKAQYDQARVGLEVIQKRIEVSRLGLKAAQDQLQRMQYEYQQKSDKSVIKAVANIELKTLEFNIRSQADSVAALQKQVELEKKELEQARVAIQTLKATTQKAHLDLNDTVLRAKSDGYVQNLYAGVGTPAIAHEPLFSFVDTAKTYIQANFNETDLAQVHAGDEVLIFPRSYLWHKVFHGVVMSDFWSTDRQHVLPFKQTQLIINENHWLNLPQRLPVQIRVIDVDDKFLLRPGMSAYVYIQTK